MPTLVSLYDPFHNPPSLGFSGKLELVIKLSCYINTTGQQEYSSRQAGITFGIVLAIIIPLVLLLVYVGYKILQKRKASEDEPLYEEHLA